jgi:hypothetical protein
VTRRKPEIWEWEYFARLGRRLTRCEDFNEGRSTRYTTVEDASMRERVERAFADELVLEDGTIYDRPALPASLRLDSAGGVA